MQNPGRMAGLFGWLVRYYAFAALALLVGAVYGGLLAYRFFASALPDIGEVSNYQAEAPGITRIYAADGALLSELAREHRSYAPLGDIPEPLIEAFLAAEDRRFHEHLGLDFKGLGRAMIANYRTGTISQGGSTITQQVAKSFLEDQDQTIERKIREAILALRIESRLGKQRILEIYLNKIFLGHGAYGVASAASRYFDKPLHELTLAECALIAGLARAPSYYNPFASDERAVARRAVVLQDMVEAGFIDEAARDAAAAEPIVLAWPQDPFRLRAPHYAEQARKEVVDRLGEEATLRDGLRIETAAQIELERAAERAAWDTARHLDRKHGYRGPAGHLESDAKRAAFLARAAAHQLDPLATLSVPDRPLLALVTAVERDSATVDLGRVQATLPLRQATWAGPYDRDSGVGSPPATDLTRVIDVGDVVWVRQANASRLVAGAETEGLVVALDQIPLVEAALYAFDHQTGYVEVMSGGLDYDRSQYNRTTQACRSPGSVYKAFYYALALDTGSWHMDSVLEAKPWEPEPGEEWNPRNIGKTLDGKVLLRTALIKSLNTPSIRLFLALGADRVVEWTRRLGITTELIADKGLSLGASCMRMDELSRAFGIYARGGTRKDLVYVRRVVDKRGQVRIDDRHPHDGAMDVAARIDRMAALALAPPRQIVDERTNFLIARLLREVVTHGLGGGAARAGVPVAGKSGSSSGRFRRNGRWADLTTDTWFVGYSSRHVAAAWVGFDDRNERSLGDDEASYTTAIPMWADLMAVVADDLPHDDLPGEEPPGIRSKVVDATHGGPPIEGLPHARIYYKGPIEAP